MTTDNQTPTTPASSPAAPAPPPTTQASSAKPVVLGLVSALPGLIAALAGAGWPGVVALISAVGLILFGGQAAINFLNRGIDARDAQGAGADAGKTAADLASQAQANNQALSELENANPPSDPNRPASNP